MERENETRADGKGEYRASNILLCPNFDGSLEAPTTANWGEEKKRRAAASVAEAILWMTID